MSDPYRAPTSAIPSAPTSAGTAFFVIGLACAALTALVPTLIVPSFSEVFRSFGASLPWSTQWLLRGYLALWILPVLVVLLRLFWPWPHRRTQTACGFGVLCLLLVLPACMAALYLPIFALSKTI